MTEILIVGGGSLGQVYSAGLSRGGAAVSLLVRPRQQAEIGAGFTVHRLRRLGGPRSERVAPSAVVTSIAGLPERVWDQVWLCVASDSLDVGWLAELRDRVGGGVTIVALDQGPHDRASLQSVWPAGDVVQFQAPELAYAAPLAEEALAGTAFWRPPGAKTEVSGELARVTPVIEALRRGGIAAKSAGPTGTGALHAAQNVPYLVALELAGWSLAALRADLAPAAAAATESTTIMAAEIGVPAPAPAAGARQMRAALRIVPLLAPLPVERYFQKHFTKVGGQTRGMLDSWIAAGAARGLPVASLRELRLALGGRSDRAGAVHG